jgi:hypothetical protein
MEDQDDPTDPLCDTEWFPTLAMGFALGFVSGIAIGLLCGVWIASRG